MAAHTLPQWTVRHPVTTVLFITAVSFLGCNPSAGPAQPDAGPRPQDGGKIDGKSAPPWQPAPRPRPKLSEFQPTTDEDFHSTPGATWVGGGSAPVLLRFNLTGDVALAALADGTCHVLTPQTGEARWHWDTGKKERISALEITCDDQQVVVQHEGDPGLYVRNIADGTLVRTITQADAAITAFGLATDPRLLAIGTDSGILQIHDLETGRLIKEARVPQGDTSVTALAFSNDCQKLFAASTGTTGVEVFRLPQLVRETAIEQPCGTPIRLVAGWDNEYLMVLCADGVGELILIQSSPDSKREVYGRYGAATFRHGDLHNWFLLAGINHFGCYLGNEAFEYLNPFRGGVAGAPAAQVTPVAEVALSEDGRLAATAQADGGVRFYALPGPGKTGAMRDGDISKQFRRLLEQAAYDELDQRARDALEATKPNATLWTPAELMIYGLVSPWTEQSEETWAAHLAELQKWLDAKPDSRAARLALGVALKNYAWHLRGGAYAAKTSEEAFQGFFEQLGKADAMLEAADAGTASAPVCAEWITVSMGLQKGKAELLRIWRRGAEAAPEYLPLHQNMANALLPKWGGAEQDVGRLANLALQQFDREVGQRAYAIMALTFICSETPIQLAATGFDLAILDEAVESTLATCPDFDPLLNLSTIVACLRVDHEAAAKRIIRSSGTHDRSMWKSKQIFDKFRSWAQGKHIAADAEQKFLVTWNSLRQISFRDDDHDLVTLADDPSGELRVWNDEALNKHKSYKLPGLLPWFMSRQNRWIVGQVGENPQVALLDQKTGQFDVLQQIDPQQWLCISPDERQMAAYGRDNSIKIYDLEKPKQGPIRVLALGHLAGTVEFPANQDPWSIALVDPKVGVRVLSAEGKDLIPPLAPQRAVERLLAIPGESRMLIAGHNLLLVADLATGKTQTLVDEPSAGATSIRYVALATNRQGTLVAAARTAKNKPDAERPFEIELWDLEEGRKVGVLAGHERLIISLSFSEDGKRLASGDALGIVQIWNLSSVQP